MLRLFEAAWFLARKDLLRWWRNPLSIVAGSLAPLVMLIISTVVFGIAGDAWPTGLVVESDGPAARRFVTILRESRSNITPYFNIVETDPGRAFDLARTGRLLMVIRIPADFDARLAAGQEPVIQTYQYNVNSDMSKNTRLRLDHVLQQFTAEMAPDRAPLRVEHLTRLPDDVWRRTFIAGGVFAFALLVGGMLYTSTAAASEWTDSTVKELLLAPVHPAAIVLGKLLAGTVETLLTAAAIFGLGSLLMDLRPGPHPWLLVGLSLLVALGSAAVGGVLGVWSQNIRLAHPVSIVLGVGFFFAAGGFTSVATMPTATRALAPYLPPSWAFESVQALLHGLPAPGLSTALLLFAAIATAGGGLMALRLGRATNRW